MTDTGATLDTITNNGENNWELRFMPGELGIPMDLTVDQEASFIDQNGTPMAFETYPVEP